MRPSSRNQPPARRGDTPAPRPGRPRLNRETVDRAWESGAIRNDPDYRPRSNNGQAPRSNWQQNSQNGRKPFGNTRGNYEQSERNPNYRPHNPNYRPNQNNRSHSFETDRRTFDEQRGQERRNYGNRDGRDGQWRPEGRPERRDQFQPNGSRPQYGTGGNNNYRGPSRRDDAEEGRYGRPPRRYNENERYGRGNDRSQDGFDRDQRPPRRYERDESPRHGTWQRDARPQQNTWQREERPPRRPDRPGTGRDNPFMAHPGRYDRDSREAQFEGDYERFDGYEEQRPTSNRSTHPRSTYKTREESPEDRQFREDVESETQNLVARVHPKPTSSWEQPDQRSVEKDSLSSQQQETSQAKPSQKPRSRAASAVSRERKQTRKDKTTVKVRSKGPKPSQRGFKWPTP
jgi:hypothetical protein